MYTYLIHILNYIIFCENCTFFICRLNKICQFKKLFCIQNLVLKISDIQKKADSDFNLILRIQLIRTINFPLNTTRIYNLRIVLIAVAKPNLSLRYIFSHKIKYNSGP